MKIINIFKNIPKNHKLLILIIIASFGPYLIKSVGLRTEHLLIYPLFIISILTILSKHRSISLFRSLSGILVVLIYITIWTIFGTIVNITNYTSYGKIFSHFENYFQPISIIIGICTFIKFDSKNDAINLLIRISYVYLFLLSLNSVIVILSIFTDLSPIMMNFVGTSGVSGLTTWEKTAQGGRFTGIFNQPMISGASHSLVIFLWAYITKKNRIDSIRGIIVLLFLFFGGVLSISKLFFLGGIPLFFLYLKLQKRLRTIFNWKFFLLISVSIIIVLIILERWKGYDFLISIFTLTKNTNLIYFFTGKRFGSRNTTVTLLFSSVLKKSPLCGLGFGAVTVLDSAYVEFFVQGGLIALFAYMFLLIRIGWLGLKEYKIKSDESIFLVILFLFLVGAGLGGPVITANRFSVVFWIILILILSIIKLQRHGSMFHSENGRKPLAFRR